MRNAIQLDHLLENAVATALGLDKPHPQAPSHLPASQRRKLPRRAHHVSAPSRTESRHAA